jgi:hypothetical protein
MPGEYGAEAIGFWGRFPVVSSKNLLQMLFVASSKNPLEMFRGALGYLFG